MPMVVLTCTENTGDTTYHDICTHSMALGPTVLNRLKHVLRAGDLAGWSCAGGWVCTCPTHQSGCELAVVRPHCRHAPAQASNVGKHPNWLCCLSPVAVACKAIHLCKMHAACSLQTAADLAGELYGHVTTPLWMIKG